MNTEPTVSEQSISPPPSSASLAPLWFSVAHPRGRVIAFEPEPHNFDLLTENLHTNGPAPITVEVPIVRRDDTLADLPAE